METAELNFRENGSYEDRGSLFSSKERRVILRDIDPRQTSVLSGSANKNASNGDAGDGIHESCSRRHDRNDGPGKLCSSLMMLVSTAGTNNLLPVWVREGGI